MAGEYSPTDAQDFTSLTESIIPSNSYFHSWNAPELTPRAENQAFQAGFGLFSPQGNFTAMPGAAGNHAAALQNSGIHDLAFQAGNLQPSRFDAQGQDISDGPSLGLLTPNAQSSSMYSSDSKMRMPPSAKDITALKERAKESIAAKRATSVRSTSQDSKPGNPEKPAKNVQVNTTNQPGQLNLSPSRARRDTEDLTRKMAPMPASNGVSRVATSTEIDDLLAEGRAAVSNGHHLSEGTGLPQAAAKTANVDTVMTEATVDGGAGAPAELQGGSASALKSMNISLEEAEDIKYWLKMTGYHDTDYRDKMLTRRRRLKEIDDERERLLREEQEDNPFRGSHRAKTEENKSMKTETPAPEATIKPEMGMKISGLATKHEPTPLTSRSDEFSLKRPNEDFTDMERSQTYKMNRTESSRLGPGTSSLRNARSRSPVRREPEVRNRVHPERRGSGEQRLTGFRREEALTYRDLPAHNRPESGSSRSAGRSSHNNITRFFLLKSWNLENIESSQKEGTWATQTKNEELFVDAFKTCKNVVFFFSANHSKSFQGYARMETLPGERGVAEPSWVRRLHWPTTDAFRIKWIRQGDTPYWMVGNLKNPLNEGMNVFVGRDGQEIPEETGHSLCDIIDDNLDRRPGPRR